MKSLLLALALAFGLATAAAAQGSMPMNMAPIQIQAPWARSTPSAAKNGAVYFTILNAGTVADTLIAASSPVAAAAELHRTENDNGVMKMLPVASVAVKAGGQALFKPGSYHVMLVGLKAPLVDGQSFPLTLTFEHAGKIDVTVKVQKAAPMGDGMGNMKM
jgi:periplasmic copper chaperone A